MNKVIVFALVLALPVQAAVFKWVDEEGNVHYGDTPPPQGAKTVDLPEYSRYAPRAPGSKAPARTVAPPGAAPRETGGQASYSDLSIVQPANEATVRSDEGRVAVQIALAPALGEGHLLQLFLDGAPAGAPFSASTIELTDVDRGRHELKAAVFDESGRQLAETQVVTFFLRQRTVDERELVSAEQEKKLTEEQRRRLEAIEAERLAQEEKQLKERQAQEAKVEELKGQGDFGSKDRDSSLYRDDFAGRSPDRDLYSRGATRDYSPLSPQQQQQRLEPPATIEGETNANRNPPPVSGPITTNPKTFNAAPGTYSPPAPK